MGMDLVARNVIAKSFHFNWHGWSSICHLISELDDPSYLSGTNDGKRIPAKVCRSYAKSIRKALKEKHIREEKEGYLFVDKTEKSLEDRFIDALDDDTRISKEWKEYLLQFCDFLDICRGCRQW